MGLFQDDAGERYVMVLNGNHEGADWPLWTHDRVTVELEFDFSGAPSGLDPEGTPSPSTSVTHARREDARRRNTADY